MNLKTMEKEYIKVRKEKANRIMEIMGSFPHKFSIKETITEIVNKYKDIKAEDLPKEELSTAGRVMAIRWHGKACFANISDGINKLQIYVRKDLVEEKDFELFSYIDIGDFIGAEGVLFRTRTGELTLLIKKLIPLSKAYLPLPEKWHGLSDVEIRFRKRYLDLIVNPQVRRIFEQRFKIIKYIREYFDSKGYIEVETPMMHKEAGGALAKPFKTYHNALDLPLFLRIAPELYLKRLIVGGFNKVYEINRNFRNEGISTLHNPEFTMLEFYQAYSDYNDLMELTKDLFIYLCEKLLGKLTIEFKGNIIDFTKWQKIPLLDSLIEIGGINSEEIKDKEKLTNIGRSMGIPNVQSLSMGKLITEIFEKKVQHKLINPTFIVDFPKEISPLAREKEENKELVERFELFIGGLEIANAYSELNDPFEQERRFQEQLAQREKGEEEAHVMDKDYIEALMQGMPPTAGEGIGIDRLTMLFCDVHSIREVILFPLMKPVEKE